MKKIFSIIIILITILIAPSFYEIYNDLTDNEGIIPINRMSKNLLINEKIDYPLKIAILGDSKKGTKVLEKLVNDAKKNGCIAVFHLGDVMPFSNYYFYKYFYEELKEMIKNYKIPIFLIPGDHDTFNNNGKYSIKNFKNFFGKENDIVKIKDILFYYLNDSDGIVSNGLVSRNLNKNHSRKFLLFHIPTRDFRNGHHHCIKDKKVRKMIENFIIENKFNAVFSAHIHSHGRFFIKNIPCYITGEAGAYLIFKRPYSYLILTVFPDGRFIVKRKVVKWEIGLDFQDYFETWILKLMAYSNFIKYWNYLNIFF